MFAEFEHRLHQTAEAGEALTSDSISTVYRDIFTRICGPDLQFDDRAALGWARIPHFYSAYYVYQYATGYAAAIAFSRRILDGRRRGADGHIWAFWRPATPTIPSKPCGTRAWI